jgi:DNA modification methylase
MTAPALLPAALEALAELGVTVIAADAQTHTSADGTIMFIVSLYDPKDRWKPAWCDKCRRVRKFDGCMCTTCGWECR